VALRLTELGFTKAYALKGGWNTWIKAGYPTEKKIEFHSKFKELECIFIDFLLCAFF